MPGRDPAFAELLRKDPRRALGSIGVHIPLDVKIDVRQQQQRGMLYFVIPPLAAKPKEAETVINQFTDGIDGYLIPDEALTWLLRDMRSTWAAAASGAQKNGEERSQA